MEKAWHGEDLVWRGYGEGMERVGEGLVERA
jgi:hypothetical protein